VVPPPTPYLFGFADETRKQAFKRTETNVDLANEWLRTLGGIKARYDPAYLSWFGQTKLSFFNLMDKWNLLSPKSRASTFIGKAGSFFIEVQKAFLEFRHRMTGAAGSDVEMIEIRKAFADPEKAGKILFEAQLNTLMEMAEEQHTIELYAMDLIENGLRGKSVSLTFIAIKKREMTRAMLESKGATFKATIPGATDYTGDPKNAAAAKKLFEDILKKQGGR